MPCGHQRGPPFGANLPAPFLFRQGNEQVEFIGSVFRVGLILLKETDSKGSRSGIKSTIRECIPEKWIPGEIEPRGSSSRRKWTPEQVNCRLSGSQRKWIQRCSLRP